MTKKMTITLEESLEEELGLYSEEMGKKKAQVVREALQDYFDVNAVTKSVQEYKMGMLKTISQADVRASLGFITLRVWPQSRKTTTQTQQARSIENIRRHRSLCQRPHKNKDQKTQNTFWRSI